MGFLVNKARIPEEIIFRGVVWGGCGFVGFVGFEGVFWFEKKVYILYILS